MFVNAQLNMSQLISLSPLFSLQFFLLFYSIFALSFSTSSLQLCHHDQKFALIQFKNSFSINSYASAPCDYYGDIPSYPKMLSWKENTDCCSWDGVTCDRVTGHIIGLDLSCGLLEGTIHSNSSLFLLPHLQHLNLAFNDFHQSPVSSEFGRFASLTHFNLSSSNFAGHIPLEISHLSKLVSLDLSTVDYRASYLRLNNHNLKKLIQNVIELRILDLYRVNMSSVDPSSLMNLSSSLTTLSLSNCGLRGKFPNNIFHLQNLHKLYLGNNYDLTGNFPKFNRSSPLEDLDLHDTSFLGELSDSFSNLQSLKYLDLSSCHFSGLIPAGLGNLTQISLLSFSFNNFRGPIPSTLSKLELLTSLNLRHNHFNGSIPTSFGNLTQMSELYLSDNHFSGSIPTSFGNLTQMSELYLSDNHFSGSIPTSFGNLTQMSELYLSDNHFSGSIPAGLGNLTQISLLRFSSNNFSGPIPSTLSKLKLLTHLDLSNNHFDGSIPTSFGYLTQMYWLDLSSNDFSGSIPTSFGNFTQIFHLNLSHNDFSGQIPSSLFKLKAPDGLVLSNNNFNGFILVEDENFTQSLLSSLDLSSNNLSGQIPSWLCNLTQLTWLDLSSNNLSGQIPSWLDNLTELIWLDLSSNNLSGLIPLSLSKLDKLRYLNLSINHLNGFFSSPGVEQLPWKELLYLDLQSNVLQGPLPVPPPITIFFSISDNRLTGEITSLICNASCLEILNLSNNNLSGIIPQCLGNFSKYLSVLDLRTNNFHGTIPKTFVKGNALRNIALNGNQLEGPIPRSIINCKKLEILDLGNNKINDTFPYWLENLPELQVLVLRFNRFYSSIRSSKLDQPFPKLRIFDISNNDFSGPLPKKYFKYLKGMMNVNEKKYKRRYMGDSTYKQHGHYQDSVMVTIKGFNIELVKILTIYTTLDLSNNKFQGEIPKLTGKLTSLRFLNFSRNNLKGKIPSSLGNLRNLESLDLSSNNLNGEIPKELVNLNFLSFLNLSQNHLEGQIPKGSQFDTFENTSYSENLGLCGAPLSKKCNDAKAPQPPPFMIPKEDNPGFATGFEWKVVAMGYGCGMVFGLVMGYFIFLIGKPEWVIRMVEGKHYKVRRLKKNGHRHGGRRN